MGMNAKIAIVILAAGLGTRMKSNKAKVLHKVCGKPMVNYVAETASKIAGNNVVLVVGHQAGKVRQTVSEVGAFSYAYQKEQLGTGHAVLCALPLLPDRSREIIILCGDVPLIKAETLSVLIRSHVSKKRDLSILAVALENPSGYGRILLDKSGGVRGIVEEADASPRQKRIKLINTGIFCVKKEFLLRAVPQIKSDNAQGEIYLTDIVGIAYNQKRNLGVTVGEDHFEVTGINTIQELKRVERTMKNRN
jgi:UDP-N-acetylglucosamine diphosphorylase/glucosamine-1-phosphate N-acetyltransferase